MARNTGSRAAARARQASTRAAGRRRPDSIARAAAVAVRSAGSMIPPFRDQARLAQKGAQVHLPGTMAQTHSPIRVSQTRDGTLTYLVDTAPDALPPVRSRDLAAAWDAAREAACSAEWGLRRLFRFRQADGSTTDLALADQDACCWAGAVDQTCGTATPYGMSVCLRLLALVDLLAHAPWTGGMCQIGRAGALLDPLLIKAASTTPLTNQAGFDETAIRARQPRPDAHRGHDSDG